MIGRGREGGWLGWSRAKGVRGRASRVCHHPRGAGSSHARQTREGGGDGQPAGLDIVLGCIYDHAE